MSQYLTYYLSRAEQLKRMGENKYAYRFQVNQKAKELRRPGRKWKDNIDMSLKAEMGVAWTRLICLKLGIS
jgi:hypothetical protein